MGEVYSGYQRKIASSDSSVRRGRRPDGTPDDNDRVEIGPTRKAFTEWEALGITPPNLEIMREKRLARVIGELHKRDLDGVLLFDPLNIRYAVDCPNMQVWTLHDFARAVFVSADGYVVLWDFQGCDHLSAHLPLVNELRPGGAGAFYFLNGDKEAEYAKRFADEFAEVVKARCQGKRIAVDKTELNIGFGLKDRGIEIHSGQAVLEHARLIKGPEDIAAMRCAIATCESAIGEMHAMFAPGISEVELWSYFHAANIARGGEWIETRLFASGPRTNPWYQEAGPRILQGGDLLSFDTDMVGPYGMCCDMSRTWLCGDGDASAEQKELFTVALEHITENAQLLTPGTSFRELSFGGHQLPEKYVPQRYCVKMHGVGLCDEFPSILYPEDYIEGAFDYVVEPGMVFTVEAYIGEVGGREGVKLEDHILVTESGPERMTQYPFEQRLL